MIKILHRWLVVGLTVLGLSACSTVDVSQAPDIQSQDVIALLPVVNYTETPEAGRRAGSIAFGILQTQGHASVLRSSDTAASDALFGDVTLSSFQEALDAARETPARYALAGSVQEWRYKVGVDGEPAVGLAFHLVDLQSGATVWSATGSRVGWSRSSAAGVAQSLIRELLSPLRTQGH
ncbi:penicillin-binding protein activator LpoB [Castellaniella sp. FW104-16D08]|uniref:penicillin-binding protein activator LpoB n=1 Tax=unclassified Castellaniella TaxID=2617606 RepID=UPI0033164A8A